MSNITTIGLDLAKNVFQVHGTDERGRGVLRKRLPRSRVLAFFANLEVCVVGMEACGSAHYWAREISALGHEVRLMPPQYVKPYVKRGKTDAADAEAIAEAVCHPNMRFVAIKSAEQQAVLLLHRSRELLVRQRTMLINAFRGHLAEFGIVARQGPHHVRELAAVVGDIEDDRLPAIAREVLVTLLDQLRDTADKIDALENRLRVWHKTNAASQRLTTIPGVGLITATALIATAGSADSFRSGRQFAAWLGLTPREYSTGGKPRALGISKRGDGYLRRLLIHGARTVVRHRKTRAESHPKPWLDDLLKRRPKNVATVALANKNARTVWALLARGENYQENHMAVH